MAAAPRRVATRVRTRDAGNPRDAGNGVVEFLLVTVLLLFLFLVIAQVGLVLHTRNVLVAAAAEGARYGANADRSDDDGAARAVQVVADSLPGAVAESATARSVPQTPGTDLQIVDVEVTSSLPVVFLPVGPLHLTVHGHALKEGR